MTGPEHYREAERLLAGAQNVMDVAPIDGLTRTECAALAQVHATLAISAPEEPAAELTALRTRITAIHYEVDGSPHSNGSCVEDGQDYPCATLRALNTEGGA